MSDLPKPFRKFQADFPKLSQAYEALGKVASESGPLEPKIRELIKLGMAAGRGSESAVHSHTFRALESGASSAEIEHAILLGITTMGFPTMMAALTWAKEAIEKHEKKGE
ncbi:MAG: carboxymuconolactone decarboxylase family protein [Anaerolineales bacterium]